MSVKKVGSFKFTITKRLFAQQKRTLPKVLGNQAKNHFLEGFRTGGGQTDKGRWKPRRFSTDKTRRNLRRGILVKTGKLRRSIRVTIATFRLTKVATNLKYAATHNFGAVIRITKKSRAFFWAMFQQTGVIEWRNLALTKASSVTIPQREFIGDSRKLERKLEQRILKEVNKVFK